MAKLRSTKRLKEDLSQDDRPKPIKGRLYSLPRTPVPWGMLDHSNIAKCGYCGKVIKPFANQIINEGEKRRLHTFYTCSSACEDSGIQRIQYLDKRFMEWIKKRVTEAVGEFIWGFDEKKILSEFNRLSELAVKRRKLQTDLVTDSFHAEEILKTLKKVEIKYDRQKKKIDTYDELPFNENPLIGLLLEKPLEELIEYDINFRMKMLYFTVYSIRVYKEYILIRAVPITEHEYHITKGFGPEMSINMSSDFRSRRD